MRRSRFGWVVVALSLCVVGLAACGGGDDGASGKSKAGSSSTSVTTAKAATVRLDGDALEGLEYSDALLTPDDLGAQYPDEFPESLLASLQLNDESTYGPHERGLRPICGGDGPVGSSAAGAFSEYKPEPTRFLFNSSVDAFETAAAANAAMTEQGKAAESCTTRTSGGNVYVKTGSFWENAILSEIPQDEERVVLTVQNPVSKVTVADLLLSDGQFVYSLRVVNDRDAPGALTSQQVSDIMLAGHEQFRTWLDSLN